MAHEAVSRAHTRTPSADWPAAFTTTPMTAPTPVVSCAAADVATTAHTTAVSAAARMISDGIACCGMSWVSCHPSAKADEFLLVRRVVAKDESARPDDRRVTLGSAPADP